MVKAATDFENAKALYHEINNELLDALPAAYDSRITFFVDTLQTLFNAESTNHSECATVTTLHFSFASHGGLFYAVHNFCCTGTGSFFLFISYIMLFFIL